MKWYVQTRTAAVGPKTLSRTVRFLHFSIETMVSFGGFLSRLEMIKDSASNSRINIEIRFLIIQVFFGTDQSMFLRGTILMQFRLKKYMCVTIIYNGNIW